MWGRDVWGMCGMCGGMCVRDVCGMWVWGMCGDVCGDVVDVCGDVGDVCGVCG